MHEAKLWIGAATQFASTGETFKRINPASGEVANVAREMKAARRRALRSERDRAAHG